MAKMSFRTQFNKGDRTFKSPTGKKTEIRHRPTMSKSGVRTLVHDKEVAIYDLIQESKEECEIERIVKRAIEGDWNVLNAVNGMYADITNCPSSLAEAQQFIIDAKTDFDSLPKEIKAKFNNNAEEYIAEMSNDIKSWSDKMGYTEALEKQAAKEAELSALNINNDVIEKTIEIAEGGKKNE